MGDELHHACLTIALFVLQNLFIEDVDRALRLYHRLRYKEAVQYLIQLSITDTKL